VAENGPFTSIHGKFDTENSEPSNLENHSYLLMPHDGHSCCRKIETMQHNTIAAIVREIQDEQSFSKFLFAMIF
jgi:hypothetical protein